MVSVCSEEYLVRTVFLVDHPSKHPRAEQAGLWGGEQKWDWDKIPSPAAVFQWEGNEAIHDPLRSKLTEKQTPACPPVKVETNLDAASAFCPGCCFFLILAVC